jgi:hypothetical protein
MQRSNRREGRCRDIAGEDSTLVTGAVYCNTRGDYVTPFRACQAFIKLEKDDWNS